jgi:transporter family-2 protein
MIPKYYILAGICGVLILAFTVFCITKIGPVMTASITVSVQMIVATLAAHYGWLGLEHEPINWVKILGIVFLVAGVILVKMSISK